MSYQVKSSLGRPSLRELLATMSSAQRMLLGIAIVNFIAFCLISIFIGGDAFNGRQVDGRYFLNSHGAYTEVTWAVFEYSLLHALSQIVTFPLGMAAMLLARLSWSDAKANKD